MKEACYLIRLSHQTKTIQQIFKMIISTLLQSLVGPPHQEAARKPRTYKVTSNPHCVGYEDGFIFRFSLAEPMEERDCTPVVIKLEYPNGHVASLPGFIADREEAWVDVQTFDRVVLELFSLPNGRETGPARGLVYGESPRSTGDPFESDLCATVRAAHGS